MKRLLRGLAWILAVPILCYAAAAAVFALAPANASRVAPAEGIRIYVASNGVHTDLLLPRSVAGVDWREEFPVSDFRAAAADAAYIGFGWGDRAFYMATPSWSDVSLGLVWRALVGAGPAVMKVGNYLEPTPGDRVASEVLTEAEYHRLAAYVRRSLTRRPDGRPLLYPNSGYGDHDAFYAATGRYSAFRTCNDWLAVGLTEAGLTAPRWSPFAAPILWWLGRPAPQPPAG
jgi:uncharacterized protein (TIGR02117 family)